MLGNTGRKFIVGIDLAGSSKRDSGIAVLKGFVFSYVGIVHTDNEIMQITDEYKPTIVGIDAPLSLPKGRESIDKKDDNHFRECDLKLRKRGIRFFPITLGPMRMLTKRGMIIKRALENSGLRIEEVYPGASYDVWKIERKNRRAILKKFSSMGYSFMDRKYSQDEVDAMCCAITAEFIACGNAEPLRGKDGCIWIPSF